MTRSDNYKTNKRVQTYGFCRVSQRVGARGSAATAVADSDGKNRMSNE